jgi:hypothetical protein
MALVYVCTHTKDVQPVGTKDRIRRWCSSVPDVVFLVRFFHFWRNEQLYQTIQNLWNVSTLHTCIYLAAGLVSFSLSLWAMGYYRQAPVPPIWPRATEWRVILFLPSAFFFFRWGVGGESKRISLRIWQKLRPGNRISLLSARRQVGRVAK